MAERYIVQSLIAQAIYDTAYVIAGWRLKSDTRIPHINMVPYIIKMLNTYIEDNIVDILEESIKTKDLPEDICEKINRELDSLLK